MKEAAGGKEAAKCRKWKREISIASKREKDWRDAAEKIIKRYRAEEKKKTSYNVLWSNTEVLRPALYNSKPDPDVRRRFRDADPLGKAVGEVLERSLYVMVDGDSTDNALKNDVFDSLVPGRGVSRVRYIASLAQEQTKESDTDDEEESASYPSEDGEGAYEQVEYEQVMIEHVEWNDFRHGFGRTWAEVPWTAFRHKLTRNDGEEKFGKDQLTDINFGDSLVEEDKKMQEASQTAKVAEFWEIWDKEGAAVFFIQENAKSCLYPLDNPDGKPPIKFEGFFPCPEPLTIVENTGSLIPIPMFSLYENQANQLDRITARIDRIVERIRLRAVYDGKLAELRDLMDSGDNEMTPIQNAQQWADSGGLEKAIVWMPVDKAAQVLEILYVARDKQKAIIDELTGISDIVRGATDPDETYGAQRLKSNYYSVRLRRMQDAVKRYARDLIRLAGEVMTQRFGPDTFAQMTNLKFPTAQEKQGMQARMQMATQQMPGQPPAQAPPELLQALQVPSWEDIIGMMRSPAMLQFRIDVETDSMIAGTLEADMEGLQQLMQGVVALITGLGPIVMSGALPAESAKELVVAVIRRARLGSVVEDAFDKMQAPQPPAQPQMPPDTDLEEAKVAAQAKLQIAQMHEQNKQQIAQAHQQAENQRLEFLEAQKGHREMLIEQMKTQRDEMTNKFDAFVKIICATIAATKQPDEAVQSKADSVVSA